MGIFQRLGRAIRTMVGLPVEPSRPPQRKARRRRRRRPDSHIGHHVLQQQDWTTTASTDDRYDAEWTVAGWVDTGGGQHNSWIRSDDRDSDEPTDRELNEADYVLIDIEIDEDRVVRPFVGTFRDRDQLDLKIRDWLEHGSPPGQWGAG